MRVGGVIRMEEAMSVRERESGERYPFRKSF